MSNGKMPSLVQVIATEATVLICVGMAGRVAKEMESTGLLAEPEGAYVIGEDIVVLIPAFDVEWKLMMIHLSEIIDALRISSVIEQLELPFL